ncbi:MAG: hypothetical protein JO287_14530 [Pseudonocardiales bacterium]|nr:hypothetical protein [Pseudonocardiales bacterium]
MTHRNQHPAHPPPLNPPTGEPLLGFLEPDQLVARTQHPVPRAALSRRASAALWILRIFAIIVSAMVIYTFFSQLSG